jgi:creatinine amidohydrolase
VAALAREEGDRLAIWHARDPGGDAHAGASETSVMLAIDPGLVGTPDDVVELPDDWPARVRERGTRAVSPSGVLGDPRAASAERGAATLERWCGEVVAMIDSLKAAS